MSTQFKIDLNDPRVIEAIENGVYRAFSGFIENNNFSDDIQAGVDSAFSSSLERIDIASSIRDGVKEAVKENL